MTDDYDGARDSVESWQLAISEIRKRRSAMTEAQRNAVKAFAVWLDAACDSEGCPLKPGIAERVSNRLTEAVPNLFAVMEELSRGRVT